MQGVFYKTPCDDNMIAKFINDRYGDISLMPEKPAHDYFDYSDEIWDYRQDFDKYSDIIMMICKAYNDMDYELTEREKC